MRAPPRYRDRRDAGLILARLLADRLAPTPVAVLALPRGGLPVAAPIAEALAAPLGVVTVRKLGVPSQPELAMGAVASVAGRVELTRLDHVVRTSGVSAAAFAEVVRRETAELQRRARTWASHEVPVAGRPVVVVDDGLATGSTMAVAVTALRRQQPQRILVAVPVASSQAVELLGPLADEVVCPLVPPRFVAVGPAYADFSQVGDDEVRRLLGDA